MIEPPLLYLKVTFSLMIDQQFHLDDTLNYSIFFTVNKIIQTLGKTTDKLNENGKIHHDEIFMKSIFYYQNKTKIK